MSDISANLALPYLQPSQAQKHVTHNEALERLDILVQLTVKEFGATEPPSLPENGAVYALGTGATGAWAGHDGELAAWIDDVWHFIAPREGWRAWSRGEGELRVWDGDAWLRAGLGTLDLLGINATADTTNRLAVAAPATLLTHEGGDHRLIIDKAAAGDTASLLFQTGFSGRAEMGTAGSEDFSIKVSPDGTTWHDGLMVDGASGAVSLPNGLSVAGQITGTAVTQSATDNTSDRVTRVGDFGCGGVSPLIGDIEDNPASGTYSYDTGSGSSGGPIRPDTQEPYSRGQVWVGRRFGNSRQSFIFLSEQWPLRGEMYARAFSSDPGSDGWIRHWSTINTTVDSNGFVKEASPIVRLFDDGTEEPVQEVGATFARHGTGRYTLSGVPPLASRGWRIEVPQDPNGNRLVFVATEYDAASETLTIATAVPMWDAQAGIWTAGAARDIPEGRWVDLRFEKGAPEA